MNRQYVHCNLGDFLSKHRLCSSLSNRFKIGRLLRKIERNAGIATIHPSRNGRSQRSHNPVSLLNDRIAKLSKFELNWQTGI
jgi:hypothetical protein